MKKIFLYGEPILRKKSQKIKVITEEEKEIFNQMAHLMYEHKGVGLSAPQIGILKAFIVIGVGDGLIKMANPKILKKRGKEIMEEGCLSFPGICFNIKRAKYLILEGLNLENKKIKIECEGLLARVFQHEIDHLEGKLIIDYAPLREKWKLRNMLKESSSKSLKIDRAL